MENWQLDFLSLSCLSERLHPFHPSPSQNLRVVLHASFSLSSPSPKLIRARVHTLPRTIHHNLLGLQEPRYLYLGNPYWSWKYQSFSFFTRIWWRLQHSPRAEKREALFLNNSAKTGFFSYVRIHIYWRQIQVYNIQPPYVKLALYLKEFSTVFFDNHF